MNKKIIATNPVAKRNYTITDTIEELSFLELKLNQLSMVK